MPTDAQIAGGHKANINNPNTSQESKEHSKQVLENEFNGGDGSSRIPSSPFGTRFRLDPASSRLS